jgi:hypothetical protein
VAAGAQDAVEYDADVVGAEVPAGNTDTEVVVSQRGRVRGILPEYQGGDPSDGRFKIDLGFDLLVATRLRKCAQQAHAAV